MARSKTQEGNLRKDGPVPGKRSVIDPPGHGQRDLCAELTGCGPDPETAALSSWPPLPASPAAASDAEPAAATDERGRGDRVFCSAYRGVPSAVGQARRDMARVLDGCPAAEILILLLSEVTTNAVRHSRSGAPGGHFTITVDVRRGEYVKVTVADDGGPWAGRVPDGDIEYAHGLQVVQELSAGMCVEGDEAGRAVWFLCGWTAA